MLKKIQNSYRPKKKLWKFISIKNEKYQIEKNPLFSTTSGSRKWLQFLQLLGGQLFENFYRQFLRICSEQKGFVVVVVVGVVGVEAKKDINQNTDKLGCNEQNDYI